MVQKSKGGKKCRSSLAGKKKKKEMKHHRKENFKKKKKEKEIECCVCMEEMEDCSDNVVTCGKVNHPLCAECKLKCKDCPMCRSHSVRPPISQELYIPILSSSSKIQGQYPKKQINVEMSWVSSWSGIYHEIRRDKYNYPIYKKLDDEKYIVQDWPWWKRDNACRWSFRKSSDSDYDKHWICKKGKLMGNHNWGRLDGLMDYNITITRI